MEEVERIPELPGVAVESPPAAQYYDGKARKAQKAREVTRSLKPALEAVTRCRELLINADADADDLAEYDAAAMGLRFTLEDWLELNPDRVAKSNNAHAERMGDYVPVSIATS